MSLVCKPPKGNAFVFTLPKGKAGKRVAKAAKDYIKAWCKYDGLMVTCVPTEEIKKQRQVCLNKLNRLYMNPHLSPITAGYIKWW